MRPYCFKSSKLNLNNDFYHLGIETELDSSLRFEKNLEAIINNEDYKIENIYDESLETKDEEEDDIDEMFELSNSFHYPVVSLISPNLGLIAGSRALQQRVDHVKVVKKRPKSEQFAENYQESSCEQVKKKPKKTIIKSHLVNSLSTKADAELNSSNDFEQRLLATLNNF